MNKLKSKTIIINTLNHSKKERLLILILKTKTLIFAIKKVHIIIININIYNIACKLNKVLVFAIFMKNLKY